MIKRFIAAAAAFMLLLSLCAPAVLAEEGAGGNAIRISRSESETPAQELPAGSPAQESLAATEEDENVIHIRTIEDLLRLAMDCSLDSWSDGKKVILENDLSLSAAGFSSIPIFNGEFDGGGHSIYDMELSSAQSPCGFFLETGKDADIHDLNLNGSVVTQGNDSVVGGVAGLNRGLLSNCSFNGVVNAVSTVGGIAGKNEATGVITWCRASGSVSGLGQTGGIVGDNQGAVLNCENRAFVNTESVDPTLRLEGIDTSSILNFIQSLRTDNAGITTDTGGVAGCSTGFVERCVNNGTVGYLHLGYNVGGVVGRSGGYINSCVNNGEVYGRVGVGGVVGQAQPLAEIVTAQNLLAGLSYRVKALNDALQTTAADLRAASSEISYRVHEVTYSLDPVAEAIDALDISNPDTFFYLREVITGSVYDVAGAVRAVSEGIEGESSVIMSDLDYINQNLNALSNTAVQTVDKLAAEKEEDVLVDDSEQKDDENITYGKTISCDNNGSVYGDNNVGGIAGVLSIESDSEPLLELVPGVSSSKLSKNSLMMSVVVTGCVNRGEVTAKHDCAGGIAGRMDMGTVSHCAAYGTVTVEDGDYAGGVCGLLYGSVKASCAKCALNAKRYVGGIVGNGWNAKNKEERSSSVTGCYALVELANEPQFAGAISGGGEGRYEQNYFVSGKYAGLGRLSVSGKAEPIPFAEYAAVENLPEEARSFTLRFVVDDAVIKEIPFSYGASFDRSVFPALERRDGAYAVWDRSDLTDLRFDTTVTAEYRLDEAVLRSDEVREDGRAVVYVDGQFQHGDALTFTRLPVKEEDIRAFSGTWQDTVREQLRSIFREKNPDYSIPVAVAEHVRVSFPEDGLDTHSLRYLTPNGQTQNYRLYLMGADGWQRIWPGSFGSYYVIAVPGSEVEFVLVSTIQSWWIVAYIAVALVILVLLIFLIVRLRKFLRSRPQKEKTPDSQRTLPRWLRAHRKPLLILIPVLALGAAALFLPLHFGSIGSAVSAYRMLKNLSDSESDLKAEIQIQTQERDVRMSTTIQRVREKGHMIRFTRQYGIPLYISEGMVCLENGRVFRLADEALTEAKILDLAVDVFLHEEIEKTVEGDEVCYSARIGGETADRILRLFTSASDKELLQAEHMSITLRAQDGTLRSAVLSGDGSASTGTSFRFHIVLTPEPLSKRPEIPQAVLDAIENRGGDDTQILSEELLKLLAAWVRNETAETASAEIDISASCGSVNLNPHYRYSRRSVEGTDVHCITSSLFKLYFTENAACTSGGMELTEAQQRVVDTFQLIPLARELCLKGVFSTAADGERTVYTVTLSADDAARLVTRILPELNRLDISYGSSRLRITVLDGTLDSIELDCGGELRVVSRDVEAAVRAVVRFNGEQADEIPDSVRAILLK